MDERASQHGPADSTPQATGAEASPASLSDGSSSARPADLADRGDRASIHASDSSVRREQSPHAAGSSLTRAYAAPATDDGVVSTDLTMGSTSRRTRPSAVRIDNQPTVISKQAPSSLTPVSGHLQPLEMGRVLLGQTLGHYELLEFVGGGGMGAVFRALDTMLNRIVAVKVLSHDQSDDEETLRRFKNEAQSAARLDHENIGRVHYVGEDGGWHYIVFEFIEGINLRDLVQRDGSRSVADSVSYMLQLGDALAHAARRDVVHRDIKPSNVLVTPEGRAKLVDMGLARLHQVEQADNDLTASGVTLGTFDYISPEQARDPRSADVRSDLYSLGCTFYFMLTGRPPFPDGTVLQKLLQHQGDEPPDARQYCPQLPDDVYRILRRLLAKRPEDRYQDPSELVAELTLAAVRLGLRPASPGSAVWLATASDTRSQWTQSLPWLVPAVALVLIVVLLNALWTPREPATPSLLGKQPRPVKTGSAGDGRSGNRDASTTKSPPHRESPANAEAQKAAAQKATPQKTTPQKNAEPPIESDVAADDSAEGGLMPLLGSAVALPKEIASNIWQDIRPDRFIARITTAREKLNWPLEMDSHSSPRTTAAAAGASRPAAATPGARIVAGKGAIEGQYRSLAAAVREAKSGEVIEVRYDGTLDEEPLDIANKRLTIRAPRGRSPVIRFRVDDEDLLSERRSMVNVDGGQLIWNNIHLDFVLPRDTSDHWSLFELSHAEALSFLQCTLTIRGSGDSYSPTASMIRVRPGLADGSGMMKDAMPTLKPVEIEARQSIFRGESGFLRFAGSRPVDLRLEHTLLALGERLVDGDVGLMNGRTTSETRLELSHVTVLAHGGLVKLTNDMAAASSMPVRIDCFDSILAGRDTAAMIEQTGSDSYDILKGQLSWNSDRCFYDGFATLWRLQGTGALQEYNFNRWKSHWVGQEFQTAARSAGWARLPLPAGRAMHTYRASDFELLDSPAIGAASDELDLGANLEELPPLPDSRAP
jgi:serine/threonine-protein kinase